MLLKILNNLIVPRRYIKALYVSHDNMKNNIRVLRPKMNFKRLINHTQIKENLQRRCLSSDVSVDDLCKYLESYKLERKTRKTAADRLVYWRKMIETESAATKNQQKLDEYRHKLQNALGDFRAAEDRIAVVESVLNPGFLALPNDISQKTPDEEHIELSYGNKVNTDYGHHLQYTNLVDYRDNAIVYLMSDTAKFDLQYPLHCVDIFRQNGYAPISSPDFLKTALIEAATIPLNDVYEIVERFHHDCSNLLHLAGKGSMLSYLGYLAKNFVGKEALPMKMISTGKTYKRSVANQPSLYNATQSTDMSILIADTAENIEQELHNAIDLISTIYKSLNIHFRIAYLSAQQLYPAECFAVRFEMYSPHSKQYIEIGRLSHFSDFISKRLEFQFQKQKKDQATMPHIVAGNILNVTRIIGIMLETYSGSIPSDWERTISS